jgi:hypothetical protein
MPYRKKSQKELHKYITGLVSHRKAMMLAVQLHA